jgi:hypothetical protein
MDQVDGYLIWHVCRSTKRIYELLEGYLRHKSDMVNLEAARAICEMKEASAKELYPAISGNFSYICLLFFVLTMLYG